MNRPQPDEFGSYYQKYIDLVKDDVIAELKEQSASFPQFLRSISDKADCAYAEGKWTIKELSGHIIDTERIMAYRLLRIARNDSTSLPGFEQDDYVKNARHSTFDFEKLIGEFEAVRRSNMFLIDSLTEEQLDRRGIASDQPVSARALLFILAGHLKHHQQVIEEKYLGNQE